MQKIGKAAIFSGSGSIEIMDRILSVGSDDILIEVICCGICGSDLRMFMNGPTARYKMPVVLGHEVSGRIVNFGKNVNGINIGDIVAIAPIIPCMSCSYCLSGRDNLCENGQVIGCTVDGGMASHMLIPKKMLDAGGIVKISERMSHSVAALSEIVGCCVHGLEQVDLYDVKKALIIGAGPIGLTFLQLLQNDRKITISGRRKIRMNLAEELGADRVVKENGYFDDAYDLIIAATSNIDAIKNAVSILHPGGQLLLFSGYKAEKNFTFNLNDIHYKELHICGSIDCTIADFRKAVTILPSLQMEKLITDYYELFNIEEAFYSALNRESIKVLLEP